MSEEVVTPPADEAAAAQAAAADDQRVPYERFQQANKKAKESADRAKELEQQIADLQASMEERETAGLPDLERERKARETAEKRLADAEKRAQDADRSLARSQRERWVTAAAKEFADPSDASAFVDLDDIEDERDAERAVKDLAKNKPHLLKAPEVPKLPGKILEDGQHVTKAPAVAALEEDTQIVQEGLKAFLASRNR
jgi:hypothetical protein